MATRNGLFAHLRADVDTHDLDSAAEELSFDVADDDDGEIEPPVRGNRSDIGLQQRSLV